MAEENINVDEVPEGAGGVPEEGAEVPQNGDEIQIEEGEQPEGEEPEEEKPPEDIHLKTKPVPAVVMLFGGAATAISCYVRQYPLLRMLLVVFISLLCFWILGGIIKLLLDRVVIKAPEVEPAEGEEGEEEQVDGEVIEKSNSAT